MLKWIALAVGATLLAACNPVTQKQDARAQIDLFHERLDAGEVRTIYSNTHQEFREVTPLEDWTRTLSIIRRSLGQVQDTEQVGFHVKSGIGGTITTVHMETRFEKGCGLESFVFKGSGASMRMVVYNLESSDLMSDLMQTYEMSDGGEAEDSTSETDGPTTAVERVEIVPFRE